MAKIPLSFTQVDVDSLSPEQSEAFIAYLAAKSAFREALQSIAPHGKRVVFTEKYGTLQNPEQSVLKLALVSSGSAKPKAAVKSLSDFLDAQDSNGFAR